MKRDNLVPITAEFLGTFMLVFAGAGAIVINDQSQGAIGHLGIALTFGLVVFSVIEAFGGISGAHINPAVTFGFWLARRFPSKWVLPYVLAQLAGALAASLFLAFLFSDHPNLGATFPSGSVAQSFLLEIILTWWLMVVILFVSSGAREQGLTAGLVIGGVVALEACFAGPICGASMNPARSFGPAIVSGRLESLWIYLVAPVLGGAIGAATFRLMGDPSLHSSEDGC